ncbi:MAG: NFACT family protein [Clostridia bacterium]|nr:NFACT family protein [Clostridia bacterium]
MPQDAYTLRYLCEELKSIFSGGKINKIVQPNNDELVFTVYTGKRTEKLLLSVNPASPRMGIIHEEKESPLTAPNFCMLMRKHLLSATIDKITLVGFDRIVRIDLTASAEFFDAVKKSVFVELMGRYSNIILTENGKILGGNRGINMFDNGVRPLIVGRPYVFPPVQDKKLPDDESLIEYFSNFNGEDLAGYLCDGIQGIATSTANDIVDAFFDNGSGFFEQNKAKDFYLHLKNYLYFGNKQPCVTIDDGTVKDVMVHPYKKAKGELKFFNYLYQAEEYYFVERERTKRFITKKERLNAIVNTAIKKAKKRLSAICSKEKEACGAEENRIKGELLLSNLYRIKSGESKVTLDNYYDGTTVEIVLDERLSVSKNAEQYYKKYNKQKRTLVALKPQKENAERELDYLVSVADEIALSESIDELALVQKELESADLIKEQKLPTRKKSVETFCREYEVGGFKVKAGRNNAENDKLTFTAKPCDIWLHAKDYHSTHTVIYTEGKTVPEKVLVAVAEITAYYSKGREGGKTEIVYTEKKNVKKPPKSKPGFVTYDNFKSLSVLPEKHSEFLING